MFGIICVHEQKARSALAFQKKKEEFVTALSLSRFSVAEKHMYVAFYPNKNRGLRFIFILKCSFIKLKVLPRRVHISYVRNEKSNP